MTLLPSDPLIAIGTSQCISSYRYVGPDACPAIYLASERDRAIQDLMTLRDRMASLGTRIFSATHATLGSSTLIPVSAQHKMASETSGLSRKRPRDHPRSPASTLPNKVGRSATSSTKPSQVRDPKDNRNPKNSRSPKGCRDPRLLAILEDLWLPVKWINRNVVVQF